MCLHKGVYNEYQQDQKSHKTDTIEGRAQKEAYEAKKSILRSEQNRISTSMLKCKKMNKMCLEKNLKQNWHH